MAGRLFFLVLNKPLIINQSQCKFEMPRLKFDQIAGEPDAPGSPGHALVLAVAPGERVLDKAKNNAFAGTPLGALVPHRAELVVAGLLSDYAVAATCRAAVARGNEVILVRGAHAAYHRPEALYGGGTLEASRLETQVENELEEIGVSVFDMEDLEAIFTDR